MEICGTFSDAVFWIFHLLIGFIATLQSILTAHTILVMHFFADSSDYERVPLVFYPKNFLSGSILQIRIHQIPFPERNKLIIPGIVYWKEIHTHNFDCMES
jgi:hypothetical protein